MRLFGPRSALSGQSLAESILRLRASKEVEARVQRLAARVRVDRAVERAVDCLLERFVQSHTRRTERAGERRLVPSQPAQSLPAVT